jgi:hypothetical protein
MLLSVGHSMFSSFLFIPFAPQILFTFFIMVQQLVLSIVK